MNSIGIIGGADGPTAIFVTSNVSPELIAVILIAAAAVVFAIWKKKKK